MQQIIKNDKAIILFDGVCNFCDASVQFVLKRDKKGYFNFAPLQSETGKKLCAENGINNVEINTIVLIENGKAYTRSTAALRIAKKLNAPWPLFYGLIVIPAGVRNFVYNIIAKNRYKLFGKKDACMLPPPEWRERFLA